MEWSGSRFRTSRNTRMGRRQNSRRPPKKRDLRHPGPAITKAGDKSGSQARPARGGDRLPIPIPVTQNRCQVLAVCALLLLAVGLIFGQTVADEFVNYDDDMYVYDNPHVAQGLTVSGTIWVFSHGHGGNWHPLTGLSHLADGQLFGLAAAGHHATNVALHAATVLALYLVLWRMTGACWPSALAAAIFALHPLRVESVAWVAERKDVLSGLCFVLTLGAYVWYVRSTFSWRRYLLLTALFALGLMAKPMLVTLPFVLLLLDYWPLGRMGSHRRQIVIEKLPLLVLAAACCAITLWVQGEAVLPDERLPFCWRAANALVSYVAYVGQLFCPMGLAVFYPHPGAHLPLWKVAGAAVLLVSISAAAVSCRRRAPYVLVGWLWYVGMLVPVVGLVQVGAQEMADRYTYLPQIGLCISLAWLAAAACRHWPSPRWASSMAATVVLLALMACAWRQTSFWRDSEALWTRALACTSRNNVAHTNLGIFLAGQGRLDEAISQYRRALDIKPNFAQRTAIWALPWPARARWKRQCRIIGERWKSGLATRRLTTTWASLCKHAEEWTRQCTVSSGPWTSSPISRRPITTWAWRWPGKAASMRRSVSIAGRWRSSPTRR